MQIFLLIFGLFVISSHSQDCPSIPLLDEAYINFIYNKQNPQNGPTNLIINYTLSPCFDCLTQNLINVSSTTPNTTYFTFTTQWPSTFYIYNESQWGTPNYNVPEPIITYSFDIQQNGNYTIVISDVYDQENGDWLSLTASTTVNTVGDNIWIPLYIALAILFGLILVINVFQQIRRYYQERKIDKERASVLENSNREYMLNVSQDTSKVFDSVSKPQTQVKKGKDMTQRVQSLDTFRGITLSIMIFVNAGGGGYVILDHAVWNGLQLADLVFPWFIWMMGFSMAISFESQRKKGASRKEMLEKVLMRTFKLALLGIMMKYGKPLSNLRFPSVLMRFAVSYFFVSLIILFTPRNENSKYLKQGDKYKVIFLHLWEYLVCLCILILWLAITFGLSVPGCPTGYIGPGGIGSFGQYPSCTGGAARYIDETILGINHMFQTPTCQPIYLTGPYDPEGILGCLTSIGMVFFGLTAGRVMVYHKEHKERLSRWLIGAVFFGIISLILTGGSQNDGWIPVNKNLWSLSFITTQCCTGLLALSFWYVIIDIKKWWGGDPFRAMGMNSITMYTCSVFLSLFFPLTFQLGNVDNGCPNPDNNTHGFMLFMSVWNSVFFLILANWMDYEKFYINL